MTALSTAYLPPHICLLKEPSEDPLQPDKYEQTFTSAQFTVSFLPPLAFTFPATAHLQSTLLLHPSSYGGIVATSPRAIHAFVAAFRGRLSPSSSEIPESVLEQWMSQPFYVIGQGSTQALSLNGFAATTFPETGTAAQLAEQIVKSRQAVKAEREKRRTEKKQENDLLDSPIDDDGDRPLLVLSGNLRRDDLFNVFDRYSVPYFELCVYDTIPNPELPELVNQLKDMIAQRKQQKGVIWLAIFSPSGVDYLSPLTHSGADLGIRSDQVASVVRVVAIGPTTAQHLKSVGWRVDAQARQPSAQHMLQAIQQANNP